MWTGSWTSQVLSPEGARKNDLLGMSLLPTIAVESHIGHNGLDQYSCSSATAENHSVAPLLQQGRWVCPHLCRPYADAGNQVDGPVQPVQAACMGLARVISMRRELRG